MDQDETTFPMDVTERPFVSPLEVPTRRLPGGDHRRHRGGRGAETALAEGEILPNDVKLYTGKRILKNQVVYIGRRSIPSKLVAAIAEDGRSRALSTLRT